MNGDKANIEESCSRIIKSLLFLGFFDDSQTLQTTDKDGKPRSYIDVFGGVMADKMTHGETDRDLVVMRHNFILEDQTKRRWRHTSTLIDSGQSFKSGGASLMSQTVGITCAIGTRLIMDGKITRKGVLSPIYKDIYEPIMKELERFGIMMIEESERNDLLFGPKAKL
jgi:saccharopine dehydrogenase-like NADP-dependent oxidoreductase